MANDISNNTIQPRSSDRLKNSKRRLSPSNTDISPAESPIESKPKKTKVNKLNAREMDEIKKLIMNSMETLTSKLNETQTALDDNISQMGNSISENLKGEITQLKLSMDSSSDNITQRMTSIENELKVHNNKLSRNEDDINRITLLNQLRLTGCPFIEGENLFNIIKPIADNIGYSFENPSAIPIMRRIPIRKNGTVIGSNTIIVYFTAQHFKDNFYSMYLQKAPLKPENIGQPVNSRIIIGENLTKINATLFNACNVMKRANKITQVYSFNGLIFIKFQRGKHEKSYVIRSQIELETLVQQHQASITGNDLRISNTESNIVVNTSATVSTNNSHINRNEPLPMEQSSNGTSNG